MREVKLETYREKAEFRQTKAFEDSKDWTDRYLKQLYINFDGGPCPTSCLPSIIYCPAGAKFNYQLSKFDDPNFGKNNLSIRKVSAINQYLETHFLGEIKDASTDILYSIVLSRDKSAARIRYAFSDATFHSMFLWSSRYHCQAPDSSIFQSTPTSKLLIGITTYFLRTRSPSS